MRKRKEITPYKVGDHVSVSTPTMVASDVEVLEVIETKNQYGDIHYNYMVKGHWGSVFVQSFQVGPVKKSGMFAQFGE